MFTKQHYKMIAAIINSKIDSACLVSEEPCSTCVALEQICDDLADYFVKDNPRFDQDKFLKACKK